VLNLPEKLRILEKEGREVRIGVVGTGQMGSGLVNLISQGEYITYDNVELDSSSFLLNLRKIQDEFFLRG